jgi:hypothetical protein
MVGDIVVKARKFMPERYCRFGGDEKKVQEGTGCYWSLIGQRSLLIDYYSIKRKP